MDKAAFGAFVAKNRKELGFTQRELAEKLHVTDKAVSKWERGLSYPDVTLLEPLAEALGMGVTELVSCRSEAPSPATQRADREMPPKEEERPEEAAVQTLLDISGESLRWERTRGRWQAVLLAVLGLLLLAALVSLWFLGTGSKTTEIGQIRVLHTEGTDGDLLLFAEKDGHLLRLGCAPDIDPAAILELAGEGDPFEAEFRWDRRTWSGTLLSYRPLRTGLAIGGPMDEVGSATDLYAYDGDALFGYPRIMAETFSREPNPYGAGYLSEYIYYLGDDTDDWYLHADEELLRVRGCLGYADYGDGGFRQLDYDGDGVRELLVRTVWPEKPCVVYDLEGGTVTETWLDEIPAEMTGPME